MRFSTRSAHGEDLEQRGRLATLEIHLIGSEGLAEEESLHIVARLLAQVLQLLFILHTLGRDPEIQAFRHLDNRGDDRHVIAVPMQVMDEAAIDLELADGKLLEVTKAGISGPEIVDCEFDTQCLQLPENFESHILGSEQAGFQLSQVLDIPDRAPSLSRLF